MVYKTTGANLRIAIDEQEVYIAELKTEIAEKDARIAELEAALRPFAVEATLPPMPGESDDPRICSKKYLIAAHAALKGEK